MVSIIIARVSHYHRELLDVSDKLFDKLSFDTAELADSILKFDVAFWPIKSLVIGLKPLCDADKSQLVWQREINGRVIASEGFLLLDAELEPIGAKCAEPRFQVLKRKNEVIFVNVFFQRRCNAGVKNLDLFWMTISRQLKRMIEVLERQTGRFDRL